MPAFPRKSLVFAALTSALIIAAGATEGRVVKITIESTTPVSNGQLFGNGGAYELLRGTAYGELDPNDRHNNGITDISLAPKNAAGKVEYKAQFAIHKPVDMSKASGILVYNVPNRGGIAIPYTSGDDSFLWRRGDVVLNSAWQGDMPIASVPASQVGIDVPIAKLPDGSPLVSMVVDRFVGVAAQASGANQTTQSLTSPGRDLASSDTTKSTLLSATKETPEGVRSGVVSIPSTDFAYADCRTVAFPGTPDPTRLCIKGGFNPALLYQLVRPAKDPFVLGAGNAAMRDVISFVRYALKDNSGNANPVGGSIKTVIGFGNSQSGRFQKHMLNNGFNEDEDGKIVWDGMNPNIAGMMGSFNIRHAQPGDIAELYFAGADGPLWWEDYDDTVRGHGKWGLLSRCRQTNTCPKIMETYGGPEAWYSHATVGMAGTKGTEDLPLPSNVRRYYHTGTTHGGGGGGFNLGTASTNPNSFAANPNPQREINRALYVDMVDWVVKGIAPPPSAYPKVSDGTLVAATSKAMGWPDIPNSPKPDGAMNPVLDYDFGPQFRYNDGSGVITNVPPAIKQVIPTLAPKVDADGNEFAGVRSLLIRVPLGTYTAWNPIASGPLKGREASLSAGYVPFAKTKAERTASGDSRLSIEERYTSLWLYYFYAVNEANNMVQERLLLPADANTLINQLLNNMLASSLLPKNGTFAEGMAPAAASIAAPAEEEPAQ
ncbi:MAG: alpha/beta hydrolase domain-containing protein [Casimicrobiaceae bacterium]